MQLNLEHQGRGNLYSTFFIWTLQSLLFVNIHSVWIDMDLHELLTYVL